MGAIAAEEWRLVAPLLEATVGAGAIDRSVLAAYCQTFERWVEAERRVREDGTIAVLRNDKGAVTKVMQHPAVSISFQALRELRQLGAELGLSPAARRRVGPVATAAADNEWEGF